MTLRVRRLSPAGRGALAVLALEGPGALAALEALAGGRAPRPGRPTLGRPTPGRPTLVRLSPGGGPLEEALVLVEGPERVELHLHGNPVLVAALARQLAPGVDLERPDDDGASLEARARALLAGAPSEAAARILLDQAEGALRRELEALLALDPAAQAEGLARLARLGRALEPVLRPPRVVLAGPVNAGKSTLFNLLVGRRRVVTSDEPGTTRDAVTERARLGELVLELVDTAGERPVPGGPDGPDDAGAVESRGQELGRALRRSADLVLWLQPADGPGPPAPAERAERLDPAHGADAEPPRVVLVSRAAGRSPSPRGPRHLAALEDPAGAVATVARVVAQALHWPAEPWVPGRAAPFEPELGARLAALAREAPAARAAGLVTLLAARSSNPAVDPPGARP